jgi:hypothetical protein
MLQAPPPLLYLDDLYNTGVLYTSAKGKEYSSAISIIERLPRSEQADASMVPLVQLGCAPVYHKSARNDWAAHLPDDYNDPTAISGAFCVLVCLPFLMLLQPAVCTWCCVKHCLLITCLPSHNLCCIGPEGVAAHELCNS